MKVSSTSQPIFLSKTLVQGSTLWIDSIWQWIPRIRLATFWSEARISQNTRLSRESDSHIYAVSIPPRSYKSLGWGSDNHVRMVTRIKSGYTAVWQRIMRIDDINELNTSTCEPGKMIPVSSCPLFSNDGTMPVIWVVPSYPGWMPIFVSLFNHCHESELLFGRLVQLLSFFLR